MRAVPCRPQKQDNWSGLGAFVRVCSILGGAKKIELTSAPKIKEQAGLAFLQREPNLDVLYVDAGTGLI